MTEIKKPVSSKRRAYTRVTTLVHAYITACASPASINAALCNGSTRNELHRKTLSFIPLGDEL